ncbi:MAG: class III signal peptide-containing protein [Endomicrobium sp.]|nr:class III signal peptide-containing protein [Endomicrobium sp.]
MFRFLRSRRGQGMVEYILIVAVVVGIVFVAYKAMGGNVKTQFTNASNKIATAHVPD